MQSISKTDCCADRCILALLSAYQEYLVTLTVMSTQVVQRGQRARALSICAVGSQRVKRSQSFIIFKERSLVTCGGAVASWFVRSTPERALRVRALARDIVLCS